MMTRSRMLAASGAANGLLALLKPLERRCCLLLWLTLSSIEVHWTPCNIKFTHAGDTGDSDNNPDTVAEIMPIGSLTQCKMGLLVNICHLLCSCVGNYCQAGNCLSCHEGSKLLTIGCGSCLREAAGRSADMHYTNAWLLRPAALAHDCAFVELLANSEQPPNWSCPLMRSSHLTVSLP
eukprot:2355117-Amphidinium_carterae.2